LALEDKYDDIKKLIDTGKEKGFLTYDQVNDLIPTDLNSPEDIEDLLTTMSSQGIDVLEGPKLPSSTLDKKYDEDEMGEDVELDLTPGAMEKTNDPVRCSPAKAKSKSPSASNAASCACSKPFPALRSSSTNCWRWART
jgi:RNA polymerase primary sigma factor